MKLKDYENLRVLIISLIEDGFGEEEMLDLLKLRSTKKVMPWEPTIRINNVRVDVDEWLSACKVSSERLKKL